MNKKLLFYIFAFVFCTAVPSQAATDLTSSHDIEVSQPLTLLDCYDLALKQSEAIAIDADAIKQSEAHFLEAMSIMLPHVSYYSTDYQEESPSGINNTGLRTPKSSQRAFTFSQTLFSGFKAFAAMKGAGYEKKQRINEKKRAEQLLFVDVANAFYLYVEAKSDIAALNRIKLALASRVKELRNRERLGRSRTSEVVNAKARYFNILASIKNAERLKTITRQLLEYLIGQPAHEIIDTYPVPSQSQAEDYYLGKAMNRFDVKSAEYSWELAKKEVVVVDSDFLPTVTANGNYYTQRTAYYKDIDWDISLQINIPIFEGTEVLGRSKNAVLKAHQQEMAYRRTKRLAVLDIKNVYENFTRAMEIEGILKREYHMSKLNYYMQKSDYTKNLVNNLDVLTAIQTLRDAERNHIHALYEVKRLYWQLLVAIGADLTEGVK